MSRPPKNPEDVKVTAAFCISKKNKKLIYSTADTLKISASSMIDAILDEKFVDARRKPE